MVSNAVYEGLKMRKGSRSFSETIEASINPSKKKTLKNLLDKCFGTVKDDKEFDELMPELKKMWKEWDDAFWKESA